MTSPAVFEGILLILNPYFSLQNVYPVITKTSTSTLFFLKGFICGCFIITGCHLFTKAVLGDSLCVDKEILQPLTFSVKTPIVGLKEAVQDSYITEALKSKAGVENSFIRLYKRIRTKKKSILFVYLTVVFHLNNCITSTDIVDLYYVQLLQSISVQYCRAVMLILLPSPCL